jgi:hypothetical protein
MADSSGGIGVMGVLVGALSCLGRRRASFCDRHDWRLKIIDRDARTAEGHD